MTDEPTAPISTGPRRPPLVFGLVGGCVLLALVAVVILVVRDEPEEPASSTTTSKPAPQTQPIDDWRAEVQAGCQRWNRQYEHLGTAEPSTAAEAVEHTEAVDALASGLAEAIAEAGLPESDRDEAEQLADLSGRMATAADDLATAAAAGDGDAVDDATGRIDSLGERIDELAESLQVPACGGY